MDPPQGLKNKEQEHEHEQEQQEQEEEQKKEQQQQACYTRPPPKMKFFLDNQMVSSDYQPMKYNLGTFQPKWFNLITNHVKYISGTFQPKVITGTLIFSKKILFEP